MKNTHTNTWSKKILIFLIKLVLSTILLVGIALLGLNFIPIKIALKINTYELRENEFFVRADLKTGFEEKWAASAELPFSYVNCLFVKLEGAIPYNKLSSEHFPYMDGDNDFIVKGSLVNYREKGEQYKYRFGVIETTDWDIVYPIKRDNSRIFASDEYLTVYDFNWEAIIDSWLK
ncbi:MAG: hypothetical protein LBS21_00690 [Clostridiales bacterium]|nr:hypothetical protein [Clostridiales bacterium]